MHPIIVSAILKFLFDSTAHFKNKLGSNCDVAQVKKAMYISAHQNTIVNFVLASLTVGANVRCLKCGKGALASNSAPSPVVIRHEHAKGALTQPRPDRDGIPKARLRSGREAWIWHLERAIN
jgi:hypothetical protein